MGTLRWEKEQAVQAAREEAIAAMRKSQAISAAEEAELTARIEEARAQLRAKRAEKLEMGRLEKKRLQEMISGRNHVGHIRGIDRA
jgi:hypothetical protein